MGHRFLEIAATPAVKAAQARNGSRMAYARLEEGPPTHDRLTEPEADFIASRDSFYLASVSETGWPYIQHRGGRPGFLKVLDEKTLAFADFRGNRQYISIGNIAGNDRVALFLMDYPRRTRLKVLGRMSLLDPDANPDLMAQLQDPADGAKVERGLKIEVEAFDWNCPQHITPRFSEAELEAALDPVKRRLADLEAENRALKAALSPASKGNPS
jgi:predicted pyridoxine 5'-phosphate oxidase superfamily flavin-nucleotide-binding protein